jgi:glucose-1-phosphatase
MENSEKKIELVMFDLGNVILFFDHMITCNKLSEYSKKDARYIYDFIFKSDLSKNYDTGKISSLDLFAAISGRLELKISFEKFNLAWSEIFRLNFGIEKVIGWVKSSTDIAILSNTDEMHFNYIKNKFKIISDFDYKFLSYEIGYLKPQKEIFAYVTNKTGIPPQRIIHIDDVPEFVDAANKSGINGILFKDIKTLKNNLEAVL